MTRSDDMVCSDDFRLPDTTDSAGTAAGLVATGVNTVVTTHGGGDVLWWRDGASGSVDVPTVTAVDTLGAGDVFHGAYAYYSTDDTLGLPDRIRAAARVAALRCSLVGPRAWLDHLGELEPLEMTP
jgi:sugar/nucleoside kinase (ribokinase family)